MNVSSANQMFRNCRVSDLKSCIGDKLNTRNCQNFYYMFFGCKSSTTPSIVIPAGLKLAALEDMLSGCSKLVSAEIEFNDGVGTYPYMFRWSPNLKELEASGRISNDGLHLGDCYLLSKRSIKNVIGILADDTEGLSITFATNAIKKSFETYKDAWDGLTSKEWLDLVASKPNWTIILQPKV